MDYLAEAEELYTKGDFTDAYILYELASGISSHTDTIYTTIIKIAQKTVDEKKVDLFFDLEKRFPERLEPFYYHMMLYYNKKLYKEACEIAKGAPTCRDYPAGSLLERCVYDYLFDINLSVSLFHAGQIKEAMTVHQQIIERNKYPPQCSQMLQNNYDLFLSEYMSNNKVFSVNLTNLPSMIVIDNFYDNPNMVVEFALNQEFSTADDSLYVRTRSFVTRDVKNKFEAIIKKNITMWDSRHNGVFHYTTSNVVPFICQDQTDYSAIICLTPKPCTSSGITIYQHKKSKKTYACTKKENNIFDNDAYNINAWDTLDHVENVYNRCIIFNGRQRYMNIIDIRQDLKTFCLFQKFVFNVTTLQIRHN
jgi:hypothetical protein